MFCAASETVADMANGCILDPTSAFVIYPPTVNAYSTTSAPTASSARLQCTEVYMDNLLSATQGDRMQQQRVSELYLALGGESECAVLGVHHPAEDFLGGLPIPVTLECLLQAD